MRRFTRLTNGFSKGDYLVENPKRNRNIISTGRQAISWYENVQSNQLEQPISTEL